MDGVSFIQKISIMQSTVWNSLGFFKIYNFQATGLGAWPIQEMNKRICN